MTLALRLGRTVGELLEGMTAAELMLWRAYDATSPVGDSRGDFHAAMVAASAFQAQGGKVSAADLLPCWGQVSAPPAMDWDGFVDTICKAA